LILNIIKVDTQSRSLIREAGLPLPPQPTHFSHRVQDTTKIYSPTGGRGAGRVLPLRPARTLTGGWDQNIAGAGIYSPTGGRGAGRVLPLRPARTLTGGWDQNIAGAGTSARHRPLFTGKRSPRQTGHASSLLPPASRFSFPSPTPSPLFSTSSRIKPYSPPAPSLSPRWTAAPPASPSPRRRTSTSASPRPRPRSTSTAPRRPPSSLPPEPSAPALRPSPRCLLPPPPRLCLQPPPPRSSCRRLRLLRCGRLHHPSRLLLLLRCCRLRLRKRCQRGGSRRSRCR
jgi:hypothetical protein